ncbi:response regulator [Actinomadura harenae]|uniref:DNA-binding response regulator n=1 Tax=Actinomadura harenae TaxID=2483351 RepID=A0A3M2LFN5_9ACTN|nr:response regulator transcription factor [Actinomadura harenae]RMI36224.1 DNA-binding response regulator [Actinomadura harenae]
MIKVLIVDDDRLVCAHLRIILQDAPDLTVVGVAHDGAEAVESVVRLAPDVVLMDLHMPGVDGLTATARIARLDDPPRVIALTTFDLDRYVVRMIEADAAGFLLKDTPPEDLIALVRVAAQGHTVLSPGPTKRLAAASARHQETHGRAQARIADLTRREREILACIGAGLSNAEIAERVHLSEATIKTYVSRMLTKLDCANRTQAARLAFDADLDADLDAS